IEQHELASYITLIEGSSIDPDIVGCVRQGIAPGESVLVLLDSCHTRAHVLEELLQYGALVSVGSYIVAADGVMQDVARTPLTRRTWVWNNPRQAVLQFARELPEFEIEEPALPFNESPLSQRATTYWPSAFLKRVA